MSGLPTGGVVVIFGGRSEIGLEVALRLAPGRTVVLAARERDDEPFLAQEVARCEAAGASRVATVAFDADDTTRHPAVVDAIEAEHGPIDIAVMAFGVLGDQDRAENDHREVVRVLHTDFVAQASLLTVVGTRMRDRGHGKLVAYSSVAGVRVRRANYVYGSGKAGLDGFATGMADALHGTGVSVLVVRPGFVIGRMSAGMKPAPFSSAPDQVADATVAALAADKADVWVPWQLRVMFAVAKLVPRPVWRRMPR